MWASFAVSLLSGVQGVFKGGGRGGYDMLLQALPLKIRIKKYRVATIYTGPADDYRGGADEYLPGGVGG